MEFLLLPEFNENLFLAHQYIMQRLVGSKKETKISNETIAFIKSQNNLKKVFVETEII